MEDAGWTWSLSRSGRRRRDANPPIHHISAAELPQVADFGLKSDAVAEEEDEEGRKEGKTNPPEKRSTAAASKSDSPPPPPRK